MKFKSSYLAVTLALSGGAFLSGCGGSSSSTSAPTTPSVSETKAFTACIDNNINGSCDSNEQSEKLATWGDTSLYSQEFPLAFTGEGLVLTAPIASTEISPWTTLLQSEIAFSPAQADLQEYLSQALDLQQAGLSPEQAQALITSIEKAFANSESSRNAATSDVQANSYQILAALTDAVISTQSFAIDRVDLNEAVKRSTIKHNWMATQVGKGALSWVTDEHDEHAVAVSAVGERALIATKYHNRLILLDTSDKSNPTVLSHAGFAEVDGIRYAIDATTGASEHKLRDAVLSNDAKHAYLYVSATGQGDPEYKPDLDKGYGLFRASIAADGTISDVDSEQTIRIADKTISKFVSSKDNSVIAALRTKNDVEVISLFNNELASTGVDIELAIKATSFAISENNQSLFVILPSQEELGNTLPAQLVEYKTSTGEQVQTIDVDFDATAVISYDNSNAIALYKKGDSSLSLYASSDLSKPRVVEVGINIGKAVIADDQKSLAVSNGASADVVIVNLTAPVPRIETSVSPAAQVEHLAMAGGLLLLPVETGRLDRGVDSFELKQGKAFSLQEIVDADAQLLSNDPNKMINNGLPLDKIVTYDLSLSAQLLRGAGADIEWASSLASIVTSGPDQGKVNRPTNGEGSQQGTLTATLSKSFRGQDVTKTVTLNTNVWQQPLLPEEADHLITGSLSGGGYYREFAADHDGSRVAVQLLERKGTIGFQLLEIDDKGKLQYLIGAAQADADTPAIGQKYHGDYDAKDVAKGTAYLGDHLLFTLKKGNTIPTGALQVFDASDATLAANEGQALFVKQLDFAGEVRSSQQQGNLLSVRVKLEDDSYQLVLVNLTVPSNPVVDATIPLLEEDSKVTVNETADTIFVQGGSSIRKLDLAGTELTKVTPIGEIRSLTYAKGSVFAGTADGNLFVYDENLENEQYFTTGHGLYGVENSGGSHGRVEALQVIGDSLFMHNKYRGLVQLDISDINNISEVLFYAHPRYRRGVVSPDAKRVFTFYYEHRGENGTSSGYADLK
ncbi:MAG: hypothetical protein GY951_06155 [Psychromonas sp.]|nr:hypothetical protein [Psychromonas sp.]